MKRAAIRTIDYSAEVSDIRIVLHLGRDHYILTAHEAYELSNILVDAAEKLTARQENQP